MGASTPDVSLAILTGAQAADVFTPIVARAPAGRQAGALLGIWAGNTTYSGVTDPFMAMGYEGGVGDITSTLQIEGCWNLNIYGLKSFTIASGGVNYAVGNTVTWNDGGTINAVITVTGVGGGGAITAGTISVFGSAASAPSNPVSQLSTSGSGTGATITANYQKQLITETYWQIVQADGVTTKRPFYATFDSTNNMASACMFLTGNGQGVFSSGQYPGYFFNWDDNLSGPHGKSMFSVTPNRVSLFPTTTGGIVADDTRLRLYSAPGLGSTIAMTYNGQDAEGYAHPTWMIYTAGAGQANVKMNNVFWGQYNAPGLTTPGLQILGGIQLGNTYTGTYGGTILTAAAAPDSTVGNNGDWSFSEDGHIYFKAAGAWSAKV